MRKVLIVITTSFVSYGGLATVMLNYYRAMDKKGMQIDFASTNEIPDGLQKELQEQNSKYFCLGTRKKHTFSYLNQLYQILKKERYDVLHVNGNSATMALELWMGKLMSIPVRIAHGHNTKTNYPLLHKILENFLKQSYTHAVAVSKQVGEWLFSGEAYIVLNNAIDTKRYRYNAEMRECYRRTLGLQDKFVVGNVGKLNTQKNQQFLLKVFYEVKKKNDKACLLIVGGGELQGELEKQAQALEITDSILFLGMKNDAMPYLQAMDTFVFPSIFEGFGLALIEAQASGLPCVAADVIPKETKVSENIQYKSLNEKPIVWADCILSSLYNSRFERSKEACESIKTYGYSIDAEAYKLEKIYRGIS